MLDAAEAVVVKEGAGHLTLDAVARRAGVSKGGLMYNFPTKDALLEAMIMRLVEHNASALGKVTERMPTTPGRALKAYVMNSLRAPDSDDRVSGALLAVVANNPALMRHVAKYFRDRFRTLTADVPFDRAAIVHLATEGLWLLELMQASPLTKNERARVARALIHLAEAGSLA
jgi:AcrR family transcriptional regulator